MECLNEAVCSDFSYKHTIFIQAFVQWFFLRSVTNSKNLLILFYIIVIFLICPPLSFVGQNQA